MSDVSCSEELAREAIYRANGSRQLAVEYCRVHESGVAGTRNPIPERDLPENAVPEEMDAFVQASFQAAHYHLH